MVVVIIEGPRGVSPGRTGLPKAKHSHSHPTSHVRRAGMVPLPAQGLHPGLVKPSRLHHGKKQRTVLVGQFFNTTSCPGRCRL